MQKHTLQQIQARIKKRVKPNPPKEEYRYLTKEKVEEALRETFNGMWEPFITDIGNGLFEIRTPNLVAVTSQAGVNEFHKAMRREALKILGNKGNI